jgi:hypothetical protein
MTVQHGVDRIGRGHSRAQIDVWFDLDVQHDYADTGLSLFYFNAWNRLINSLPASYLVQVNNDRSEEYGR